VVTMVKHGPYRFYSFSFLLGLAGILSFPAAGWGGDLAAIDDRAGGVTVAVNNGIPAEESPASFMPPPNAYSLIVQQLRRYQAIAESGGWPEIPADILLKNGDRHEEVPILRRRLAVAGALTGEIKESAVFDEELKHAVINFQQSHGLKADGVIGPLTVRELNVPVEARAQQILVNLERLRWIYSNLSDRYIYVNIADYTLAVIEDNRPVLSMKVVVGKPYWDTPVISSRMTTLIINPSWNIPESIVAEELLPHIQRDPVYLAKQNISVIKGWKENSEVVDPDAVNWLKLTANGMPYHFQQQPGPLNPLGRIKFMFANKFNVYLHDTPAKGLFDKGTRAFSHGCIRIEKPFELARYLLQGGAGPGQVDLDQVLAEGNERIIDLARPIDIHVVYLTAWPDEEGRVQFRDDIYGRDAKLLLVLRENSPDSADHPPTQGESAFP